MRPDAEAGGGSPPPRLSIPEIRDYQRINAELISLLDQGHREVYLDGAEGQRLLASGLRGGWRCLIEIEGATGPELAADLDAPGVTIMARGRAADGLARGVRSGTVVVLGGAGDGCGFGQSGGTVVVVGPSGHRAGLAQSGGTIAILGPIGRLPCDRQSGGRLFYRGDRPASFAGRGRSGGRLIRVGGEDPVPEPDRAEWLRLLDLASLWGDVGRFRAP